MKRLCAPHGARTPFFASGIPPLLATELGRSCYRAATQPRDSQDKSPANRFALFAAPKRQNACSRLYFRGGSYLRPLVGEKGSSWLSHAVFGASAVFLRSQISSRPAVSSARAVRAASRATDAVDAVRTQRADRRSLTDGVEILQPKDAERIGHNE